jgi:threonyl-tRNA synthetase
MQNSIQNSQSEDQRLHRIRHSLAHLLAQAVMEMRPGAKLGFGPPIEDGFYYDFILPEPILESDFPEIEKRMARLIQEGHAFKQEQLSNQDALKRIDEMGEPYKRQYAEELIKKKNLSSLSFYRSGPFLDMCDGPHVLSSKEIPMGAFKLRSVAGAYWRGDSKNVMMTRIYAWAFLSPAELEAHVKAYLEAQERDHKKLGRELDLFVIDEVIGKGLPLWLPHGTVIRDELEKMMRELEFKAGYERVVTPHLAKTELYHKTGHLPYYADSMYPFMELREKHEGEEGQSQEIKEAYVLKPMNCPHHHRIFAARKRSYRELPLRLAEYGQVYRFEDSGALSGLLRVRGMCQNDAHIYCSEEQILDELKAVIEMHREVYSILGLTNYRMRLSTYDPNDPKRAEKFVNDPAGWEHAEKKLREVLDQMGLSYYEGPGEAAFYGPKIDFQFKTVTGREETASTLQLDFAMSKRLGLVFTGADNQEHHPYILHRAPLGTHERFVAFLIEHYRGAFPTWLAPVQVRVVPVSDRFNDYAKKVVAELRSQMIRAEADFHPDSMGKKIRNAAQQKIPNVLVVGEREQADSSVALRRYGQKEQQVMSLKSFKQWVFIQASKRHA